MSNFSCGRKSFYTGIVKSLSRYQDGAGSQCAGHLLCPSERRAARCAPQSAGCEAAAGTQASPPRRAVPAFAPSSPGHAGCSQDPWHKEQNRRVPRSWGSCPLPPGSLPRLVPVGCHPVPTNGTSSSSSSRPALSLDFRIIHEVTPSTPAADLLYFGCCKQKVQLHFNLCTHGQGNAHACPRGAGAVFPGGSAPCSSGSGRCISCCRCPPSRMGGVCEIK